MIQQSTVVTAAVTGAMLLAAVAGVMLLGPELRAQQPLALGEMVEGVTRYHRPSELTIGIEEPGVLTVAVQAEAAQDLVLKVTDRFYQPVLNGESDRDLGANPGAEQLAATIARPGEYRVLVGTYDSRARFTLVSGFLPFPNAGAPDAEPPAGSTPETAPALLIGEPQSGGISLRRDDLHHWYRVEAPGKGQLVISTEGDEGDVVLYAFERDNYRDPAAASPPAAESGEARRSVRG